MIARLDDDYPKKQTQKKLDSLESELHEQYSTAWDELSKKTDNYFSGFTGRDEAYKKGLQDGTIIVQQGKTADEQYAEWRTAQIGRGSRWEAMRDDMANHMVNANQIAADRINKVTPAVAALNHNYTCYQVDKNVQLSDNTSMGVSWNLLNEQAILNLSEGANQYEFKLSDGHGGYTFRKNMVNSQADYNWNSRKIQTALTQGILQGESIPQITKRFMSVMESNHKAAVRNARTAVTSAENAGTMQAYQEAADMGIELEVEWMATRDKRTRDSHAEMDGVRIKQGEKNKFPNGLRYPGDPQGIPAEVYNCRCTTRGIIAGINDKKKKTTIEGHEGYHSVKTYNKWLNEQRSKSNTVYGSEWGSPMSLAPSKYKDGIISKIQNAPTSCRAAWNKVSSHLSSQRFDLTKGAHFDSSDGMTHYASQKKCFQASDYQEENACFFHEYGHNIDYLLQRGYNKYYSTSYKDNIFGKTIYSECEKNLTDYAKQKFQEFAAESEKYSNVKDDMFDLLNYQEGSNMKSFMSQFLKRQMSGSEFKALNEVMNNSDSEGLRNIFNTHLKDNKYVHTAYNVALESMKPKPTQKMAQSFCREVKKNYSMYERTDISDMYEEFFVQNYGISYPFGIGHGKNYFEGSHENLAMESFAEMFSASVCQNQSLDTIKEHFPESYSIFEEMLGAI